MILSDAATIERHVRAGVWGEATLDHVLRKAVRDAPDRLALADAPNRSAFIQGPRRRLSFAELDQVVGRLAALFAAHGFKADDVVVIQMPNCVEAICTILACLRLGLIAAPVPLLWREHELLSALPQIAPRAIVTGGHAGRDTSEDMVRDVAANLLTVRFIYGFGGEQPDGVTAIDEIFEEGGDAVPYEHDLLSASVSANDVATICWAGVGSAVPAPVPRSHNQWIAAGLMSLLQAGIKPGSALLNPYPPTSLVPIGAMLVPWLLGACTLNLHHPFDTGALLTQLEDEAIAYTLLPPSVIDALAGDDRFVRAQSDGELKTLGCVWPGPVLPPHVPDHGAGVSANVVDIRAFGELAYTVTPRTEGMPPGLMPHGDMHVPSGQEDGPVLISSRLKGGAVSNATFESLLSGELMLQSPAMFDRFFPSATEDETPVLARDGRGSAASGVRCRLVGTGHPMIQCIGRDANVIFHGGMAISATELDRLYAGHERLSDAAAFSFDDPVMGERILAAVVPNPGETITLNDFRDYLEHRKVATYKVPDRLVTVRMIPRNDQGEVLRDKVLDQI